MVYKILIIAVFSLFSGNSISSGVKPDCETDNWFAKQVLLHGDENAYFEKIFHNINQTGVENIHQKDYESLECLAETGNAWALLFLSGINRHIKGKGSFEFYSQIKDLARQHDQVARLINMISFVHALMYEDISMPKEIVGVNKIIPMLDEWLQSSKAFNYISAARISYYSYSSINSRTNGYAGAYVELNKLIAEGFDDAKPFYYKLITIMPEDKVKKAKQYLAEYQQKFSDEQWKAVQCTALCCSAGCMRSIEFQ